MRFSIITPTFNQADYLGQSASSILAQPVDLQWIVVDGGSTDATVDLLRQIDDPRLTWSSEPDSGQAHAINKGMGKAEGDVVAWLNSDDLYTPGALQAVEEAFAANPTAHWLVGHYTMIDADGKSIRSAICQYKHRALRRYSYAALLRQNIIPQPSVFWRRSFGRQIGLLDESLHWTMDYDLWLRMGKAADPLILPQELSRFRLHRRSKSGDFTRRQFDEGLNVARRHAAGDRRSLLLHRLNIEKIVWAYRAMRLAGL